MNSRPAPEKYRLTEASRFLADVSRRHPEWWASGALQAARGNGAIGAEVAAIFAQAGADEAVAMREVRRLREREMARIACRDLLHLAPLDETLGDLSDLADACCAEALAFARRALVTRHGLPRDESGAEVTATILGMGKLGGRELNFSSDIDLIFCHSASGETDGPQVIDNGEFHARVVRGFTRLLSERTPDGYVFRIDTLLRPFGSAGPASISFAAAEEYYQTHGREWERYAMIKARPVAGDIEAGRELLRELRPFVYRRYLDFNAIGALRDLKRMIAEDVARRGQVDNVKLGTGGIRELEFIVQSFQLVRGGQDARLRDTRLRPTLRHLAQIGLLSGETAQRLDAHYVFLRRLENAIQIYADQQTHVMPQDPQAREALCIALGYREWSELAAEFEQVRAEVHEEFRRVFAEQDEDADSALRSVIDALWTVEGEAEPLLAPLQEAGFGEQAASVWQALRELRGTRIVRALSATAQERLRELLPLLLEECATQPQAGAAALRTLAVVQAIGGRSTYLTLLRESANTRSQLVRLCAASPWISQLLAQSPALLDGLLDPRALYAPPTREQMQEELGQRLSQIPVDDTEAGMDALRRYRLETTLRIAAADLAGALPLVQVSDRLTWLAETVLQAAFERSRAELEPTVGHALRSDGQPAGMAAIAFGKFGGIELGYGSDLDLVFVHDCDLTEGETVGGTRAMANVAYFSRWMQRIIHWLSTLTPAGRAYEVDLELRPSGRSGLAVVGIEAFSEYERHQAWTWEHQALTRARFVAGSEPIASRFAQVRREVLCAPREAEKLRQDIVDMRQKMRANLDRSKAGLWDVKQGEGGVIDIEFLTQYLILRDAPAHPDLVRWSDNWRQLEALAEDGSISAADKETLIRCYRGYRAFAHLRALQNQPAEAPEADFAAERTEITALWRRYLGVAG